MRLVYIKPKGNEPNLLIGIIFEDKLYFFNEPIRILQGDIIKYAIYDKHIDGFELE